MWFTAHSCTVFSGGEDFFRDSDKKGRIRNFSQLIVCSYSLLLSTVIRGIVGAHTDRPEFTVLAFRVMW